MKRLLGKWLIWSLLKLIFFLPQATASSGTVMFENYDQIQVLLKQGAIVQESKYQLSDIAILEGNDPALLTKLSNVTIGRSPLPGGALMVTHTLIKSRLRPYIKSKKLLFPDLKKTQVRRAAIRINGNEIDQVVLNHIDDQLKGEDSKVKLLSKSRDLFLPKGELDYEVKNVGRYQRKGGYRTYEVVFKVNQKMVKKVPVRVHINIYREVYVAKDRIRKNHLIQENDLEKIRKNVGRLPDNYVTDKSLLVGKIAKRVIDSNEILHDNTVSAPPLVNTGDHLLIVYETPSLKLTANGVAMKKGHLGERIPVRNLTTKTLIQAVVKEKNTVQVY